MAVNLNRIVHAVGAGLTPLGLAPSGLGAPVSGVAIWDGQGPEQALQAGCVVLGIGLHQAAEVAQALAVAAQCGATALVVKLRQPVEAPKGQCALLSLEPGENWMQVLSTIQAVIGLGALESPADASGEPQGDLYRLADAAAAMVGGSVVIEDHYGRVVAYSGDQDTADDLRLRTLLLRRMPEDAMELFRQAGVMGQLGRSEGPVYVEKVSPNIGPRLAVLVRSGERILGSIWAVVAGAPSEEQRQGFARVARLATLELLRQGAHGEGGLRLESETLAHLIYGGAEAMNAARKLNLMSRTVRYRVAALALSQFPSEVAAPYRFELYQRLNRLRVSSDAFVVAGELNNTLYVIVQGSQLERDEVTGILEQLTLPSPKATPVAVGVGDRVEHLGAIPDSRRGAEQALGVARSGHYPQPIAFAQEVWAHAALLKLREGAWVAELNQWSPLRLLEQHDGENHTEYVPTLRAWLRASGDTQQAAKLLNIHVNTLRYRLSRLQELVRLDLEQPEVRLVLWMQLSLS